MIGLASLARALGGGVAGRSKVLAPGPGHSRADRSMSVMLDAGAPDGFRVHSFAGDDWKDCRDLVRQKLGLGKWKPGEKAPRADTRSPLHPLGGRQLAIEDADADAHRRRERAGDIWRAAMPIVGTPAETYLASRGLAYDGEALRWHPACPFAKDRLGCMVALVRDIRTNAPQAIHRTAISAAGRKLSHLGSNGRLSMGAISGGAVKLTDDADVTLALGTGEGIETALSLGRIVGLPVWATVTAGNLAAFPVLAGIESLWIAVDNDKSGTGERAAQTCIERQEAADVETITATPDAVGADLNDRVGRHAG